jgi:subtilase family serine protease
MRLAWWFVLRTVRTSLRTPTQRKTELRVEGLESRDVPSVVTPDYVLAHSSGATAFGTTGPTGFSPTAIRHAYGFDQVSFAGSAADGTGTTIAIVDAYDDPSIASDLHAFDQQFGLPDPVFTKVNQTGGSTMPAPNTGWAGEISLDVEWAHAIAPGAKILLVEASSSSLNNLLAAVDYAAKQPGVAAVSMSWGGGEFSGETSFDSHFLTPAGHSGVVFVASSGDSGSPTSYPATSPYVLTVGGTTLHVDGSGNYSSESGWSGSGGGISGFESQPSYQKGIVTQSTTARTNPDVAYDSDPNTGFSVYQTYGNSTSAPWLQYGGTSDAAPQWAALVAIADQGRALAGEAALSSTTLLPMIYQLPSTDFHDVTTGTSTGSPHQSAGPGYDLVTGRGTPIANNVIADLIGSSVSNPTPTANHFAITAPTTAVAGTSFTITVTAENSSNSTVAGFTGTVHFTSSDTLAGLPTDYAFTANDQGVHTFTVTLKKAGRDTITATSGSLTGSSTVTVSPGQATHLAFVQQPANATVGSAISPAVTVAELDNYGNVVADNSTVVTLTLSTNPSGATLTGGSAVVSNGVATFTGLSLNQAGTGFQLTTSAGTLTGATSAAFNVTTTPVTPGTTLESFESGLGNYYYYGNASPRVTTSSAAAHDGTAGLLDVGDGDWYLRLDSAAQINPGDTVSVWTRFTSTPSGRAYFGFGTTANGTLSAVLAANTGQLIIQNNAGFGFTDLAAVGQTYQANHWYRVEVAWGTSGTVIVRLYDSNGTTLLNSVTVATNDLTPGGFAFRATGSTVDWDTVTVSRGVNAFALPSASPAAAPEPGTTPTTHGQELWTLLIGPSTSSGTQSGEHKTQQPGALPPFWSSHGVGDWFGEFGW